MIYVIMLNGAVKKMYLSYMKESDRVCLSVREGEPTFGGDLNLSMVVGDEASYETVVITNNDITNALDLATFVGTR